MIQLHEINISANGKHNFLHLTAKQYDKNSHRISCKLIGCTDDIEATDTAKASAYINGKTVDVINCSLNANTQKINFLLSTKCLMQAGRLMIDVSVFSGTSIKFTFGAIVVDVIKSADGNVQDIDCGSSLFEKLQEISDRIDNMSIDAVNSELNRLARQAMRYITETVSLNNSSAEYRLSVNDIAPSSPVKITVKAKATGSEATVIRTDGDDLVDISTGNIVDGTMTEFVITANDVISGIKATEAMSVEVKYYSANCEDLLQMINGSSTGFTVLNTVYDIDSTTQASTIFTVQEDN